MSDAQILAFCSAFLFVVGLGMVLGGEFPVDWAGVVVVGVLAVSTAAEAFDASGWSE